MTRYRYTASRIIIISDFFINKLKEKKNSISAREMLIWQIFLFANILDQKDEFLRKKSIRVYLYLFRRFCLYLQSFFIHSIFVFSFTFYHDHISLIKNPIFFFFHESLQSLLNQLTILFIKLPLLSTTVTMSIRHCHYFRED